MFAKTDPLTIATGVVLTGTLTAAGSPVAQRLGDMATACVWIDYTRAGGSGTGRPIVRVRVSRDAPSTAAASVGHWSAAPILDGGSFSAGAVELYGEQDRMNPTAAGVTTWHRPGIDVSGAHWLSVEVADVDGVAPGTCALYYTGRI